MCAGSEDLALGKKASDIQVRPLSPFYLLQLRASSFRMDSASVSNLACSLISLVLPRLPVLHVILALDMCSTISGNAGPVTRDFV